MTHLHEFDAIGTHWWLERLDGSGFTPVITEALATRTAEFDQRYSRFRNDSLIAELARTGVLSNPSAELVAMLEHAHELFEASNGAFSLLVGNPLQALGYGKQFSERSDLSEIGWDSVLWDEKGVRVPKGLTLDFGGFGKGWLIDDYARILREHGVKEFIVNGGGDLYVEAEEPISFALEHPRHPTLKIGDIRIKKGALAASSTVKRAWKQGSETYHHIIDPSTGKPSNNDVVATFVCAHTALVADSLATVLIIRPELNKRLRQRYNVETLLINSTNIDSH